MFETHKELIEKQKEKRPTVEVVKVICKTPLAAIRMKCKDCCNGSRKEIEECPISDCPLWIYRIPNLDKIPLKLIRAKCKECSGGSKKEVLECMAIDCALWVYRSPTSERSPEKKIADKAKKLADKEHAKQIKKAEKAAKKNAKKKIMPKEDYTEILMD